ncbi:AAA family ATPase [Roseibium sp.]|uniref:AAA family ATPase n=1 Tax=Roseibium sp. TaxID=1936156 RepID=UPI00326652AB
MSNVSQHVNSSAGQGYAALSNVARFFTLIQTLQDRGANLPGIGVFHGKSGFGKTIAAIFAQNKTRALRLEVGDSWTKKKFLEKLLAEAGVAARRGSIADLTEWSIEALADDFSRPLIIDEADKLVDKGMIELVREIYEHAQVPVLLIGEEMLPEKLMKVERVHNRVLSWVQAQPCSVEDAQKLAQLYCPDLHVSPELIHLIVEKSEGRARRICVNLNLILQEARVSGADDLGVDHFSAGFFYTGEPRRIGRRAA